MPATPVGQLEISTITICSYVSLWAWIAGLLRSDIHSEELAIGVVSIALVDFLDLCPPFSSEKEGAEFYAEFLQVSGARDGLVETVSLAFGLSPKPPVEPNPAMRKLDKLKDDFIRSELGREVQVSPEDRAMVEGCMEIDEEMRVHDQQVATLTARAREALSRLCPTPELLIQLEQGLLDVLPLACANIGRRAPLGEIVTGCLTDEVKKCLVSLMSEFRR